MATWEQHVLVLYRLSIFIKPRNQDVRIGIELHSTSKLVLFKHNYEQNSRVSKPSCKPTINEGLYGNVVLILLIRTELRREIQLVT